MHVAAAAPAVARGADARRASSQGGERRRSLQAPGSRGPLEPNDDAREKEQAWRRRYSVDVDDALSTLRPPLTCSFFFSGSPSLSNSSGAAEAPSAPPNKPTRPEAPALSPTAIAALYQNCLKLASENKITTKNTWALPLIDHLSDLVASDAQNYDEDGGGGENRNPNSSSGTDFQRASLTLAAGVSIYAHRVDAVHGDVFKILGGLGRGSSDAGDENNGEDGAGAGKNSGSGRSPGSNRRSNNRRRNRGDADADPSSTLDPLENITAKKFDLAFAVDPLFQRTAALFDEGGAAGLLLNSLPLLGGPALAFDSAAVPCSVDAGAANAGTVGGGKVRLPLGCLAAESSDALRALADPAAARPCPAQLALAEAAGEAVLPAGDDGGARELVAGVAAEIEAAEQEAAASAAERSGVEAEGQEGNAAGNDGEQEEEEGIGSEDGAEAAAAAAGGGWPELERAMAAADRAAAATAAPLLVVAAAPAAADAAAAPPSASPVPSGQQREQQHHLSDDDEDLGGGFGGGEVEEEEAGAARAAAVAAAAASSPVLGGGGAAAPAPAWLGISDGGGGDEASPMTPASPAVVAGGGVSSDDRALRLMLAAAAGNGGGGGGSNLDDSLDNNTASLSSHQTPPDNRGIARAVSHVDEEPPPTHAKAWAGAAHWRHRAARAARAGAAHWRHRAARAARAGVLGEKGDGGSGGRGMFGAPTPVQSKRGGNALSYSLAANATATSGSGSRPDLAFDFAGPPPLDPRALARAPARLTTLRAIRAKAETLLPDDVHYSPAALSRLFDAPETTPAAAAAAAAAGAAAAARRRLLGVSEDGEEGGGGEGRGKHEREEEEEEEELPGGLGGGGSDSDGDEEEAEAAAAAAARAIATAAIAGATAAATTQPQQQAAVATAAEAALLHSLALPDPNALQVSENPFAAATAGWGGTAPPSGSAAAAAASRAAAAAAASSGAPMAYARAAKRVDVRALKVALWAEAREAAAEQAGRGKGGKAAAAAPPLLFSELVSRVADGPRGRAAAPPGQLSPHLVFICLLHLCNEHSLELGRTSDGKLSAVAPSAAKKKLQPAVSLGGGADLTVSGVEVE